MSEGLDTALARRLHASGVLSLEVLRAALDEVRGQRGQQDLTLGVLLVARGLLPADAVADHLRALGGGPQAIGAGPSLAGYSLVRELGRGGMGRVWEVRHELTQQRYALKELLLDQGVGPEDRERFRREAEVLAKLDHPGLVRVHSANLDGPRPAFVLDLLPGGSLQERIAKGVLDEEEALRVVREVAGALTYLHGEGILHRDLKPENVLFDDRGKARLTDFGLARIGGMTLTQTGEILGTPAYMSPEQIVDSRGVDERSDVYALGALLYAMLSGQPPFRRATALATLDAVLREAPRPLRELRPDLSLVLERACLAALEKDPELRPGGVRQFLALLVADTPPRLGAAPFALAGAFALLCVVAVGVFARPSEQPQVTSRAPLPTVSARPETTQTPVDVTPPLPAFLELPKRGEDWQQKSLLVRQDPSRALPWEKFLPEIRERSPTFTRLGRDAEVVRALHSRSGLEGLTVAQLKREKPSRFTQAGFLSLEDYDDLVRASLGADARYAELMVFAWLLRGERRFFTATAIWKRETDLELAEAFTRAGAAAGHGGSRQLAAELGLVYGPRDWEALRSMNRELWEREPETLTLSTWYPEPWDLDSRERARLRAFQLVVHMWPHSRALRQGAGPFLRQELGTWPKSWPELERALPKTDYVANVARPRPEWLGRRMLAAFQGKERLLFTASELRWVADQKGFTKRERTWIVTFALVAFDTPLDPRAKAARLPELAGILQWARFLEGASAANYLASYVDDVPPKDKAAFRQGVSVSDLNVLQGGQLEGATDYPDLRACVPASQGEAIARLEALINAAVAVEVASPAELDARLDELDRLRR